MIKLRLLGVLLGIVAAPFAWVGVWWLISLTGEPVEDNDWEPRW